MATTEKIRKDMGGSGGTALTSDGNLSLIDDIGSSTRSGKQFIMQVHLTNDEATFWEGCGRR